MPALLPQPVSSVATLLSPDKVFPRLQGQSVLLRVGLALCLRIMGVQAQGPQ